MTYIPKSLHVRTNTVEHLTCFLTQHIKKRKQGSIVWKDRFVQQNYVHSEGKAGKAKFSSAAVKRDDWSAKTHRPICVWDNAPPPPAGAQWIAPEMVRNLWKRNEPSDIIRSRDTLDCSAPSPVSYTEWNVPAGISYIFIYFFRNKIYHRTILSSLLSVFNLCLQSFVSLMFL
jgi:hypothetical protein